MNGQTRNLDEALVMVASGQMTVDEGLRLVHYLREREAPGTTSGEILSFQEDWRESALEGEGSSTLEHVLVLDRAGELATALTGHAERVTSLRLGEDPAGVWEELAARGETPDAIVHAWSWAAAEPPGASELGPALERGVLSLLALCRAIVSGPSSAAVRVMVVYPRGREGARPVDAAVGGFVRSVRVERSRLDFRVVEVPAGQGAGVLAGLLAAELGAVGAGVEVRYRNGRREVLTFREQPRERVNGELRLRGDGVYLVTGGLGGLGRIVAEHLASRGAGRLVLIGRSEPDDAARAWLAGLAARAVYLRADISQRQDVQALFGQVRQRFGLIRGVVQAAGVVRDAYLQDKTAEQVMQVLGPKVAGTVWLDEATSDEPLDFFCLFSSIAGVMGNPGQADYAYANRFLDRFAQWRSHAGRPGRNVSIAWPFWDQGGMRLDPQTERLMRATGLVGLQTAEGLQVFEQALLGSESRLIVVKGDPERIRRRFAEAGQERRPEHACAQRPARGTAKAADLWSGDWLVERLHRDLTQGVCEVLKVPCENVSVETQLSEFGFDSITLTELTTWLNQRLDLELMPSVMFEHPTLAALAHHLINQHQATLQDRYQEPGTPTAPRRATKGERTDGATAGRATRRLVRPGRPLPQRPTPSWEPGVTEESLAEPVAVVGLAGVMPGSGDLDEFWAHLVAGRDLVSEIPLERWDWREWHGDPLAEGNRTPVRWGAFMTDVDKFDCRFFGISPAEAELMDPQQRLFLETVWKAIEDAGHRPSTFAGTATGLFVGVGGLEYLDLLREGNAAGQAQAATGMAHSVLANRVSYVLDLRGPSEPVDTACSASLVAVHRAVASIQSGECEQAVAGGVNVLLSPTTYVSFSQAGMLAADGRCKTFDARANGYVRGEGVGAVVLRPLSRALADGDHVYALIRSTAVNHGGHGTSLTAPNPNAQADLLVRAYRRAGIDPATVTYIETHGTGTSLGDPIEVNGLKKAFAELYAEWGRSDATGPHCGIGSVKTNIGHLETAAGIAGLIKVLLAMRHGVLPGLVHFEQLNPLIRLEGSPFFLVERSCPWQHLVDEAGVEIPRRAGISSFGYGGANAHIVVEEHLSTPQPDTPDHHDRPHIVCISAKTPDQLHTCAHQLTSYLHATSASLADICYTLQVGREPMAERLAVVAADIDELREKLTRFTANAAHVESAAEQLPGLYRGSVGSGNTPMKVLVEGGTGQALAEHMLREGKFDKLARCWTLGLDVDWRLLHPAGVRRRLALPTSPFRRDRHWISAHLTPPPSVDGSMTIFFRTRWEPAPLQDSPDATRLDADAVLVLAGDSAAPAELLEKGPYRSHQVLVVTPEDHDEHYHTVAGALRALDARRVDVVHLWSEEPFTPDVDVLRRHLDSGVYSLLRLTRALMGLRQLERVRLLYAHPAHEGQAQPQYAAVAAFLRSLMQEDPRFTCRTVEIAGAREPFLTSLMRELSATDAIEVRYEDGGRLVKRLVPEAWTARPAHPPLRRRGVYLIVGGLGGLGMHLAEHLARTAQARLVLAGRSALGPESERRIRGLEELGAEVVHLRADVSRREDVDRLVNQARSRFGKIHGVVHAAGVLRDGYLLHKTDDEMGEVLAAKVLGTVLLDQAIGQESLDFFAACSSIAGILGNAAQADYAFANSFLGHYASLRHGRPQGGRRLAIHWPLWGDGGMGVDRDALRDAFEQTGAEPLPTAEGIRLWEGALSADHPEMILAYGEPQLRQHIEERFGDPAGTRANAARNSVPGQGPPAAAAAGLGEEAQEAFLGEEPLRDRALRLLRETLSMLLKLPADEIEPEATLQEHGLESIVVRHFNEAMARRFGPLPKTLLYEYPTLRELADYLVSRHAAGLAALDQPDASPRRTPSRPCPEAAATHRARCPDPSPPPPLRGRPEPRTTSEDIAIIGVAGRYPGARDLDEFWSRLQAGHDCVTTVPPERWDAAEYYDPDPEKAAAGKAYCKWGAFLEGADRFDPLFFGIAPREAEIMDPQERLFLQTAWATFEDAGYTRRQLRTSGGNVGVFAGVTTYTYLLWGPEEWSRGNLINPQTTPWSLANRISFLLDLHGPSMPVDTACSSSLTALHLACQSLRSGECDMALAGGVNLYLHPSRYVTLCQARMLSPTGRCRSFGAGGDGFVPGEGVGAVLLKPLRAALRDRDQVYALIKGTAVNHGGSTAGYTVPNLNAQAQLIEQALDEAGVDPRTVTYIEAHGTGTQLGDPIEIAALTKAFRARTGDRQFCAIGSAKSNIGHLESAAGIAGLTKVLLQLRHRELVPTLHSASLNPNIDLDDTPFRLQHELGAWLTPTVEEHGVDVPVPRRAGVSSFGAGGANAHVVVEEFLMEPRDAEPDVQPQVIVLSARSAERLRAYAARLAEFLMVRHRANHPPDGAPSGPRLMDVAFTLQVGREPMDERLAFVASSLDEAWDRLTSFAERGVTEGVLRGCAKAGTGTSRLLVRGRAGAEYLRMLVADGELDQLAQLWVSGVDIDWTALHGDRIPRRICLSTYPFAEDRYWFAQSGTGQVRTTATGAAALRLHPLLAANTSTLREQRFSTRLDAHAFFLRDHTVAGQRTLPGVASLEMARAAVELAGERPVLALRDVLWTQAVVITGEPVELHVGVFSAKEALGFELYSHGGEGGKVVHAQGRAVVGTGEVTAESVDVEAVKARSVGRLEGQECYQLLEKAGFAYGPTFRAVRQLFLGERESLAQLELPAECPTGFEEFGLHPSVMDGALHTVMGLLGFDGSMTAAPFVPFAVREVRILGPLPQQGYAYATPVGTAGAGEVRKFDITVTDDEGRSAVRVRDLTLRALPSPSAQAVSSARGDDVAPLFLRRAWRRVALPATGSGPEAGPGQVLVLGGEARRWEALRELGASAVAATDPEGVFRTCQQLVAARHEARVVVIYPSGSMPGSGVAGLARTVRLEYPPLRVSTVELEAELPVSTLWDELRRGGDDVEVRYADGHRWVAGWEELAASTGGRQPFAVRSGGVCLVTGGAGGLGRIFAGYLARIGAATLVLVGRSELDAAGQRWLTGLREEGTDAVYLRADVSRREDVDALVEQVRDRFGGVHGIIHAAGVLRDRLLVGKTDQEWGEVCAPKVAGVVALDEATRDDDLDFFVLFSSAAGALGNPGQADYAYANRFLDAYAHCREELRAQGLRRGRTTSIGWPLWAEGGMRVDEHIAQYMDKTVGSLAMPTEQGLAAFETAMAFELSHVAVLYGHTERLRQGLRSNPSTVSRSATRGTLERTEQELAQLCAELLKVQITDLDPDEELSSYGLDSILMTTLLSHLERAYGTVVEPSALAEHHTIRAMAAYLMEQGVAHPAQPPALEPQKRIAEVALQEPAPRARFIDTASQARAHVAAPADQGQIAVVGIAVRFPRSGSVEEFWHHLRESHDLVSEVPPDRWDVAEFYSPDKQAAGKSYSKWGGFVDDIYAFDAAHFGISDQDALVMDPHHRLLLELTEELLAGAGYRRDDLAGTRTGVWIGGGESNYLKGRIAAVPVESMKHAAINAIPNMMAARISDFFDLKGSSQTIDTACSSSLVAVHQACQALRAKECDLAVVGGVELITDACLHVGFSKAEVLSDDGVCSVFDEHANGLVPGEGAGLVLLKPYEAAVRDGDEILSVILGGAVNNDGHTMGLTVPSSEGQREVLQNALDAAGVTGDSITYLEAHGTGTLLGDPIEIRAATEVYGAPTLRRQHCAVGSVKSNMGHLMRAAGISALIKTVLALHHKLIPPTLHCARPHPRFRFTESLFYPVTEARPWQPHDGLPRRAGVSSFGFGGTNCHVILEEFVPPAAYRRIRQPLPAPAFARRYYRLGHPITDTKQQPEAADDLIRHLLDEIEQGRMEPDEAAELIGADNIGREAEGR